ncbi:MAG: nitroreductase family protein [Desulfurellaceae bacterium]|nr:nitroreductase family protein [Desulfurellaceae bacterium]
MNIDLDLNICDKLLTTTRSIRRRLDLSRPVPPELIEECLEVAVQSPSATNTQKWRFMVIRDADKRAGIAGLYKQAFESYWEQADDATYGTTGPASTPEEARGKPPPYNSLQRMIDSAVYLGDHLHEVPVHVLFCVEDQVRDVPLFDQATAYGSILPAAWSFMLAARARGLGCCWTTVHLTHADEAAKLLNIPDTVTQCVLLPVAYYTGTDFKAARRIPATQLTHWDTWGQKRDGS